MSRGKRPFSDVFWSIVDHIVPRKVFVLTVIPCFPTCFLYFPHYFRRVSSLFHHRIHTHTRQFLIFPVLTEFLFVLASPPIVSRLPCQTHTTHKHTYNHALSESRSLVAECEIPRRAMRRTNTRKVVHCAWEGQSQGTFLSWRYWRGNRPSYLGEAAKH